MSGEEEEEYEEDGEEEEIVGRQPFEGNPFLRLNGKEWQAPRGKIYVTFEQAEALESGLFRLRFSAIPAADYDDFVRDTTLSADHQYGIAAFLRRLPIYLIELDLSARAIPLLTSAQMRFEDDHQAVVPGETAGIEQVAAVFEQLERRWLVVEISDGGGIRAVYYGNLFGPGHEIRLAAAATAAAALEDDLDKYDPVALQPDASVSQIQGALSAVSNRSSVGAVAFYDVGQGTAQGLLSAGAVLAYVDFGGGAASHTSTFPAALLTFCFTADPPIVLSHWDEDHWSSGGRDTRSYSAVWIAPRPSSGLKLGFHHRAHASAVIAAGTLLIWPASQAVIRVGQLSILKCSGKSRNASGLAVEILPPLDQWGKPVLLPADAGYADLPVRYAAYWNMFNVPPVDPYDAIACPHHGGLSNSASVPGCPQMAYARLAYSYGDPNHYSHPLPKTWGGHHGAGWADKRAGGAGPFAVRNTKDRTRGLGHIGFAWGNGMTMPKLPCGGICQLQIQQS